jgi:hypothetical protein
LKTFKTVIIDELWKLLNQKILVNFIFFGIVFLDALGAILPKYLDRKVTMFAAFPLILYIYLLNASKKNILFIISLIFNFLGIYNFNNPYERYNSAGLVYHTIAFFLYCIIFFKDIQIVNWKTVLKLAIPIVLIVLISVSIYSDGMRTMLVFKETIMYVSSATIFMLGTFLLSLNKKNEVNYILMFSGISILLSSVFQGYNLFLEKDKFLGFFAVIFFNLTHYLACLYLIKKSPRLTIDD